MSAYKKSGGPRFPGLLFSGVVAGALGFALSAGGTSSSSSSSQNTDYGTSSGQYGTSADSGMNSSSSSGTGAMGTGSSSSGSGIGGTGSSTSTDNGTSGTGVSGSVGAGSSSSGTGVSGTSTTGSSPSGTGVGASSSGSYGTGMEGTSSSSLPPNVSPGWKIRVCSEKTKADQINFKFSSAGAKGSKSMGATGSTGSSSGVGGTGSDTYGTDMAKATGDASTGNLAGNTASWTRGEATEITLPPELRDANKIRLEATPSQKDKKASVCVIYNDHVAKKLSFDDHEVSTVKATETGECGC